MTSETTGKLWSQNCQDTFNYGNIFSSHACKQTAEMFSRCTMHTLSAQPTWHSGFVCVCLCACEGVCAYTSTCFLLPPINLNPNPRLWHSTSICSSHTHCEYEAALRCMEALQLPSDLTYQHMTVRVCIGQFDYSRCHMGGVVYCNAV